MRKDRMRVFKIIAALAAAVFVVLSVLITIFLAGNPVSRMSAKNKAVKYINEQYGYLDLTIKGTGFDFIDRSYIVYVVSETSGDTYFEIYYDYDKVEMLFDTYDSVVASGYNTMRRIAGEYIKNINIILKENFGEEVAGVSFYSESEKRNQLPLDVFFSKNLITDGRLCVIYNSLQADSKYLSDIFIDLHDALNAEGYIIEKYCLTVNNEATFVEITDVTPSQIESGILEDLIENARISGEYDGVGVYTK